MLSIHLIVMIGASINKSGFIKYKATKVYSDYNNTVI